MSNSTEPDTLLKHIENGKGNYKSKKYRTFWTLNFIKKWNDINTHTQTKMRQKQCVHAILKILKICVYVLKKRQSS